MGLKVISFPIVDVELRRSDVSQGLTDDSLNLFFPDLVPTSLSAQDDYFQGSAVDAKWYQWNFGALTTFAIDPVRHCLTMDGTGVALYRWSGLAQPIPASEFVIYTKTYARSNSNVNYLNHGLLLADNTLVSNPDTANFATAANFYNRNAGGGGFGIHQADGWGNWNDGAGGFLSGDNMPGPHGMPVYIRWRVNAGNAAADWSADGRTWNGAALAALAFVPAYMGLSFSPQPGVAAGVDFQFFRCIAGAGTSVFNATQIGRFAG